MRERRKCQEKDRSRCRIKKTLTDVATEWRNKTGSVFVPISHVLRHNLSMPKNKSVFDYEGRSIDFGIEEQNLELEKKMAVVMSKRKTVQTNLSGNHTCIIIDLS
jgi:hypothetical protein